MNTPKVLCDLDEIEDGASIGLWPDQRGHDLVVAVRAGGRVHAYLNLCPHHGRSRLGWKKHQFLNGDGSKIICAAHGALFEIESGRCTLGPCLGQVLTRLETWVEDGNVVANDSELPARDRERYETA